MFNFMRKNKAQTEPVPNTPVVPVYQEEDDTEIVAVIAAAVASILQKPVSGFRIRSIRRASNWKNI